MESSELRALGAECVKEISVGEQRVKNTARRLFSAWNPPVCVMGSNVPLIRG